MERQTDRKLLIKESKTRNDTVYGKAKSWSNPGQVI
jgi:hypothetical protein